MPLNQLDTNVGSAKEPEGGGVGMLFRVEACEQQCAAGVSAGVTVA